MPIFKGAATALVTPFKGGRLDKESFLKLIDFQIDSGIDALVICGTTGEASTMTFEEKTEAVCLAKAHSKNRVPIIAGTGGNNTKEVILASQAAQKAGADALLVVTPYYNKTTQSGLIAHYNAVADSVSLPIIVYNVPSRTGLNVLPATMKELSKHKNIVAIKEASGNISQITELAAICPEIDIYSGNDDHILPVLSVGGKGVISTISNVMPKEVKSLCKAYFDGDIKAARDMQFGLLKMFKAAFCEVNPIPIKSMLSYLGKCSGELRLPLVPPSEQSEKLMKTTMKEYGLLDD